MCVQRNLTLAFLGFLERQKLESSRRQSLQSSSASSVFEEAYLSPRFSTVNTKDNPEKSLINPENIPVIIAGENLEETRNTKSAELDFIAQNKNEHINSTEVHLDSNEVQNDDENTDGQSATAPKFKIHSGIFQCHKNGNEADEIESKDE